MTNFAKYSFFLNLKMRLNIPWNIKGFLLFKQIWKCHLQQFLGGASWVQMNFTRGSAICLTETSGTFYWLNWKVRIISSDFFQNQLFFKVISGIPSECHTVWIQTRPHVLSGLIWVQTVCKSYQQTKLVGTHNIQDNFWLCTLTAYIVNNMNPD